MTNINRALKTVRFARRSFRGLNCPKGNGKRIAAKADRRLGRALSRNGGEE